MGTIGIDYLSANLSGELPFLWNLVIGTLFVAMIILLPNGLAALVAKFLPARRGAGAMRLTNLADAGTQVTTPKQEALLSVKDLGKTMAASRCWRVSISTSGRASS